MTTDDHFADLNRRIAESAAARQEQAMEALRAKLAAYEEANS